jgi:hypothetical protein
MNNRNILNISEIYFNNNFKITSNGIFVNDVNILGQSEAKITTANISNITSTFFKYADNRTSILNKFCVSCNIDTIGYYDSYPNAAMIIGAHSENGLIVINNTDLDINSTISIISSNNQSYPILKFNKNNTFHSILIDNNSTFKLTNGIYDSNVYFKYITNSNILTIGHSDMITIWDNDRDDPKENKIFIGCPYKYNSIHTIYSTSSHINKIKEETFSYNINIFGDVMIKNHKNNPIFSTYNQGDINCISLFGDAFLNISDIKYKLTVNGNISCNRGGITDADALFVDGPATIKETLVVIQKIYAISGISSLSDRNVKDELQIITNSLEKINKLTGYIYKRTDTGNTETGLIAQDVEKVLPEVINTTKDNLLSIDYGNMMGLIVEGIKSLEKRLKKLEDK